MRLYFIQVKTIKTQMGTFTGYKNKTESVYSSVLLQKLLNIMIIVRNEKKKI